MNTILFKVMMTSLVLNLVILICIGCSGFENQSNESLIGDDQKTETGVDEVSLDWRTTF